jgi:hypothetical protein
VTPYRLLEALRFETRYRATNALLSGSQPKVGVTRTIWLLCGNWSVQSEGKSG